MNQLLSGKVIMITGGGQGLGFAMAKGCAENGAITALQDTLDTTPYEDMKTYLEDILDKLTTMVPMYDSASGGLLGELSATATTLLTMLQDLTAMIGAGSLSLSLEEFSGKLEEYKATWNQESLALGQKMTLTMDGEMLDEPGMKIKVHFTKK